MAVCTLSWLTLFGCAAPASSADRIHPARVTPQQAENSKFCLNCHKAVQNKVTHAAMEAGCTSCHEIKDVDNGTTITLTAQGNALCFTCHADKNPAENKGRVHAPVAQGDCTTCHNPHASANKSLLVQASSGGQAENICLTCHDTGVNIPEKGSRHAALDGGCDTCHVTHKTGDAGKPEFVFHLSKAVPALCLDCHDAADQQIAAAHKGQPIATSNCVACHSPHSSDRPKLTYAVTHPPFAERQCEVCHETPKENKIALLEGGKSALCLACHDVIQQKLSGAKNVHTAVRMSETCTVCHDPHASPYPQHLKQPPVALCESCHTDIAQARTTKKFQHAPVFQSGCTVCHLPHASNFAGNLRAQVDDVCLTCHAQDAQGESGSDDKTAVLFGGTVRVPTSYLAEVKRIPLRRGATMGHPMATHPVSGLADPANPNRQISCVSCHNPHASNGSKRMFVTETKSSSPLCVRCHQ